MSTVQTWRTTSLSLDNTLQIAATIGEQLRGGELLELVSDLGGGKTAFVKGLAAGLGSSDQVSSPSFTLSNQYQAGQLTLYHYDFYRLNEPGIMQQELAEVLDDKQAVVVIEWADIVESILPERKLTISLTAIDEYQRELSFSYPEELTYLLKGLQS